ncbi:MAG: LysR family transcriptional regulator [Hyphomicrobiaceae bacterium]
MPRNSRNDAGRGRSGSGDNAPPIDLDAIDLKLLSVFEAVMSECSFSRAGRRLGMTQSAVSQAIARLRPILHDELFERTGRGVRPTPRACELDQPIRQALGLLRTFLNPAAGFDPGTIARTFFIAMMPDVAEAFAVNIHAALPSPTGTRLYVVSADGRELETDLRYGEPELAIVRDSMDSPGFRNELLFTEKVVVVAKRNHPAIKGQITWEDYTRLGHVVLARSGPSDPTPVDVEFKRRGDQRHVPMALPTAASVLKVVEQSELVCTLGHRVAAYFASQHDLEIHNLPFDGLTLPVFMVWHERFETDRGHVWLRNLLRSILK